MGWLIAIAVLILLGFLPLGIWAEYDGDGGALSLSFGPVFVRFYPNRRSRKKDKRKRDKNDEAQKFESVESKTGREKGTLSDFVSVAQFVFEVLSDLRRKLRINDLYLKLVLAGGDPCDLSVHYGRAWAALGTFMPQLERLFVIKKRNVEVACDYLSDTIRIYARIHITITVARLLSMVCHHGIRGLRKYYKLLKQIKGGATT
jgi:hypothetical protein